MRARTILAALLAIFLPGLGSAKVAVAAELHTFYGEVKAVDLAAKTITLKSSGKSFVFHITNETKISSWHEHVRLEKVRPGQGATVVMRLGPGGVGLAVSIRFEPSAARASFLAQFSVKTIQGETISGMPFNNYVVYQPPPDEWAGALPLKALRGSMFQLLVRPDGTVADAKPLRGLGYPELDARSVKWLKKWRFRPNSITEARMPMSYTYSRY